VPLSLYEQQFDNAQLILSLCDSLFIHQWLYNPLLGPGPFFSFIILHIVGRTLWTGDQPIARPLPTHRTAQTQNKRTQTSMPRMGFKPTNQAFERAKTVHALRYPYTYESGLTSLTREPGSDIFLHTRMSGPRTLLVHFSIQNEFIEAN
jgi:hypothetical protein